VLVEALNKVGVTADIATLLSPLNSASIVAVIFAIGFLSTVACNVLNNIPMTILFARVLQHPNFNGVFPSQKAAFFALIIGSNLGANLLFIGSLAGLMWNGMLKNSRNPISQFYFFKYCVGVTTVCAAVACGVLALEVVLIGF
jgi:arsenical pump membrane protein